MSFRNWFRRTEETPHEKCYVCGKIGHREEMQYFAWLADERFLPGPTFRDIRGMSVRGWFHPECFEKYFRVKRCPCGKSWIKDTPKKTRKAKV